MSAPAIYTNQLTRRFGGHRAVDRVTFSVASGAIVAIIGPQGAGKTTLLQLLAGCLSPSSGVAEVLGYDVWTEREAIRAHTFFKQVSPSAIDRWRGDEILSAVQSSIRDKPLIVLDEPTTHLQGAEEADFCRRLASSVRDAGATLVLAGVRLGHLDQFCDSIGVMSDGELLALVPVQEIHSRQATCVEIRGRGFTPALVALLRRRAHLSIVAATQTYLCINLLGGLRNHASSVDDSAPLVTLLVESGAEVEEVYRRRIGLAELTACTVRGNYAISCR